MKYAGTPVNRSSERRSKTHEYRTSAPNDYPSGSVPMETGWEHGPDASISRIKDHNRVTVCRPKR